MRTYRSPLSSMSDRRAMRCSSPEERDAHFVEEARVDLVDDLQDAAAAACANMASGQRSSASGSSVWLV